MNAIFKTYDILLDIKRATTNNKIEVVEGDNGNIFHIVLTDNNVPVDLSDTRVVAVFSSGDGTAEQDTSDTAYGEYVFTYDDSSIWVYDSFRWTNDILNYGITLTGGSPTNADTITVDFQEDGISVSTTVTGASVTIDQSTFVEGMASVLIGGNDVNEIYILVRSGSYSSSGINECEIQIYSGDSQDILVTTAKFNFQSRRASMNDETIQSEDKFPILVGLIAQTADALSKALPFTNAQVANVTTLPAGSDADVTVTVGTDSVTWDFEIPRGQDGAKTASDTPALSLGVAASGVSDNYSRADHVHPMPSANDVGAVPSARKVNNKALSSDITLTASDVSAVPTSRTVNSKPLSSDVTLTASDVGASSVLKFTSFSDLVWTSSTPHSSDTDSVYPERLTIPCTGVTATMMAEVVFGVATAASGEFSPICECYDGGVYVWAKTQTTPTILSILVHE